MPRPALSLAALSALVVLAACGEVDPTALSAQKPFVVLTVDTTPAAGAASGLPAMTKEFALSSTFAFDHACAFEGGLRLSVRADAAPALDATLGPWAAATGSKYAADCAKEDAPCDRTRAVLRWDAEGGRFDAQPAKVEDGVPSGTVCVAEIVADALAPDQVIVEGRCENLLGSFTKDAGKPVFGPVKATFRALCPRP